MNHSLQEKTTTSVAIIAIVTALALLGVVVITVAVTIPLQQQAEARSVVGECAKFVGQKFHNSSAQQCHHLR
jgi:hypothetical protein